MLVVRGMILAHTVPISILGVEAAVNQDIKALLPKIEVDTSYLAAMLRAQHADLLSRVSTAAHGTKRLETRVLAETSVPLPPLQEQRRIAAILDGTDAIRTKRRQALARLEALIESVFYSQFGDPELNPRRLNRVEMLNAVEDTSRFATKIPQSEFNAQGRIPIIDQGIKPVAGYTDEAQSAYPRDLPVILFGDHTRVFKYVDEPFVIGADGVKVLTPASGFEPLYLFHALRVLKLPAAGYSRHFKFLKERRVLMPPVDEQREFCASVEAINLQAAVVERALAADDELFASLQSQAFRGEL